MELTDAQDKVLRSGKCPFCLSLKFLHGPCGGCSENIRCSGCGKEFALQVPFKSDVIERDCPELYRDEFVLKSELGGIQDGLDNMFGKPTPQTKEITRVVLFILICLGVVLLIRYL